MLAVRDDEEDMQRDRIQEAVRGVMIPGVIRMSEEHSEECRTTFLTGSFSRGSFDPWLPNVNIYFVAQYGRGAKLRLAVADWIEDVTATFSKRDLLLEVDCHPYTLAQHKDVRQRGSLVTLTTKVLQLDETPRLSLPPTIGLGWLRSYEVLFGDHHVLEERLPLARQSHNLEWFVSVHEALMRYKGLLDHLPWALDWKKSPAFLSREALRYAEEAIRDAVPVCLTEVELQRGLQFDLLHQWANGTEGLLAERLGPAGTRILHLVASLKARARECDEVDANQAESDWLSALEVWQAVWNAFCRLVDRECPEHRSWLTRVNAFV